jgi:hypothetical protein
MEVGYRKIYMESWFHTFNLTLQNWLSSIVVPLDHCFGAFFGIPHAKQIEK